MKLVFFSLVFSIAGVLGENFTFTYDMAKKCKEHVSSGYSYKTYYEIETMSQKPGQGYTLEMHIAILARSNGHVLLSTKPNPQNNDPVYEIVIGGGDNTFSELRRHLRRNGVSTAKSAKILSAIEYRAFYIKISDGLIEFGKEGEPLPLFFYNDVDPLDIKYFSFAAWTGLEAKFLYDCPAPNSNSSSTPKSKEVEPVLTISEQLRKSLLQDRLLRFPTSAEVKISIVLQDVLFDAYTSKLTTTVFFLLSWVDNSLAWNPTKFNGTGKIHFHLGEIWTPKFFVFNSHDIGKVESMSPELIYVDFTGDASYHFMATIDTYCPSAATANKWPRDEYSCVLIVAPWEAHEKITLIPMINNDDDVKKIRAFNDLNGLVENAYDVQDMHVIIISVPIWNTLFIPIDNETHQSDKVMIELDLVRNSRVHNIVFYTPLLVLVAFMLTSFFNIPLEISRVWFYMGVTVFICMGLCYIDYLIPCHTVPTILILYITVLYGALIALLTNVLLMTPAMAIICKTAPVQKILTSKWFRVIFILAPIKKTRNYDSYNECYNTLGDDEDGVLSPNEAVEEMETDISDYGDVKELAAVIDKLYFVVYSIVFAVMLALHY